LILNAYCPHPLQDRTIQPLTASNVAADTIRNFSAGFTNVTESTNPLSISERRLDRFQNPETSRGLPSFLADQTHPAGLLSGWRTPWSVRAPSALQPPRASEYPATRRLAEIPG
jgi:hypothetical protein